ncbi:16S rRNA (guanine(966)-N(2))-methyltransferase RsmD [Pontibacillus yanchengensis]|uniref:16S rRNA (Guanine(966)-N(2))-methyltransferase RsmD n=2 Tax=Pontibacillus yanchengensis TaxID=462910 RepID=A0ACC7VC18_9BACI|nr:16S rRNA (guanine(966)-N(2))-methyltransferase RsmD [Pontibacillus yanchengensis]MYL33025.1 16S rRNA (guanine(966)-N(2))-methyltransferase RsmD [Pontibacillus yanchengensis]MYL52125.1 16S rRNA (guanine(966)-N(2))-methyltransferase RsmD [Pontibacillus yanchengensis]
MRIISGTYKGRSLRPVPHKSTRPTTDKVKEALFHMIGPYFQGGIGLDLFAGSGGLGIEGLSRGMERMIFVDKHPKAISTIYENIKSLDAENKVEIYRNDAFRALKAASKRGLQFDYIFLDPPYDKVSFEDLFEAIHGYNLLNENGLMICEHSADQSLPEKIGEFSQIRTETYSSIITISLYQY